MLALSAPARLARRALGSHNDRGDEDDTTLWADERYPYLMVFTGDSLLDGARRSVAVEPMTCPPNALADGVDVVVLEPGEDWAGTWTLGWTAAMTVYPCSSVVTLAFLAVSPR